MADVEALVVRHVETNDAPMGLAHGEDVGGESGSTVCRYIDPYKRLDECQYTCQDSHMTTNTADITLSNANGKVIATVNGEQIAQTADRDGFVGRIDKALRAAKVFRQTGYEYVSEAGVFVAQGVMI